jgi:hypothetical protein
MYSIAADQPRALSQPEGRGAGVAPPSIYNHPGMGTSPPAKPDNKPRGPWTPEEIARNERVNRARLARDREKTPEERLEETVRLSRFISELRQGAPADVRAR